MPINYSPSVVTSGLVFYYDAENVKSYPGTGTNFYDLSSNGVTTIDRSTTTTDFISTHPKCFDFDGTNDRFRRDSAQGEGVAFSGSFDFTWGAWAKPDVLSGTQGVIGRRSIADDIIGFSGTTVYIARAQTGAVSGGTAVVDVWNHIVATGNSTNLYVYLNGIQVNSGAHTTPFTGGFLNWYLGCKHDAYGEGLLTNPLNGKIAIAKCYNICLTDDQVLQNFNAHRSRFGI
jgi:hypothetical protein